MLRGAHFMDRIDSRRRATLRPRQPLEQFPRALLTVHSRVEHRVFGEEAAWYVSRHLAALPRVRGKCCPALRRVLADWHMQRTLHVRQAVDGRNFWNGLVSSGSVRASVTWPGVHAMEPNSAARRINVWGAARCAYAREFALVVPHSVSVRRSLLIPHRAQPRLRVDT